MKITSSTTLLSLFFIALHVSARTCPSPAQTFCVADAADTSGLTCGTNGRIGHIRRSDPKQIYQCKATTLEGCRDSCLTNRACHSFRWSSKTLTCSRYRATIEKLPFKSDESSPSVVYDAACYQAAYLQNAFQLLVTGTSDSNDVGYYVTSNDDGHGNAILFLAPTGAETFAIDSSANMISIGNDQFQNNLLAMETDGTRPDELHTLTQETLSNNGIYPVTCALESSSSNVSCQNGQSTQFYKNADSFGLGPPGSDRYATVDIQAVCPSSSTATEAKAFAIAGPRRTPKNAWN